jgi:hypothetical protein
MAIGYIAKNIRKNHHWTEDEEGLVRMFYDSSRKNTEMIAGLTGATIYGVKGKAAFLGLMHEKPPVWTERELKYLRNFCHEKSIRMMSRELHRTPNAVKIKCVRLHLHTRLRDGWYDKMDVCEMLGVDHHKVQAWIDRGDLKARWHDPELKPNAKGMAMWHIEAADLKAFIICHCQELQGRNIDLFSILDLCGVIPIKIV